MHDEIRTGRGVNYNHIGMLMRHLACSHVAWPCVLFQIVVGDGMSTIAATDLSVGRSQWLWMYHMISSYGISYYVGRCMRGA